jgi:hypothetical protein
MSLDIAVLTSKLHKYFECKNVSFADVVGIKDKPLGIL